MKNLFTSNTNIKYTLLSILFSIMFIFTALNISNPITVYADDSSQIGQVLNLGAFSTNETDESSNARAGYLFWAASGKRSGIYYYVIDDKGWIRAHGIIMDNAYEGRYGDYCTIGCITASSKINAANPLGTPSVQYEPNVSPVYYSDGWKSKGSDSMAYLTEIVGEITIKGHTMDCPRWAYLVTRQSGNSVLESLAKPDTKWTVFVEPVSVGYLYTDETFGSERVPNTVHIDTPFEAGSPKPVGTMNQDGSFTPHVYGYTANSLLNASVNIGDTGRYRYKFYETQLPFSLCLDHDAEYCRFVGGSTTVRDKINACDKSVQRLLYIAPDEGIAIASIDITGISLPPIHTYDGTNTPGNTEIPSPANGTDGDCTIKKLYYTQYLNSNGAVANAATEYHPFTQTSTTNYISIDSESGYEIEGWKTSISEYGLLTVSNFESIPTSSATHNGTSSQEITLDETTGEKYLYILYKKIEVLPSPPDPWDFQLNQSQITKRVIFLESSGPANTPDLITHNFTWTAPAPSITSCTAHGGSGHHLYCIRVWDRAPVTGVPHQHAESCYTLTCTNTSRRHTHTVSCYSLSCSIVWDVAPVTGIPHTHTNSCYDTPCTNFQWTDNTTKLGITLDTSTINKAVVSKNWSVTYNATTVNTITTSNKYYKENTSTRSGTGANTQSISQFNFITVLFRGQDHLTLADWKNNAAGISKIYLTNIAYDSSYNFKSANTPQGTRKSGTEYTETFATKFVNRSPDASTTYKATVGAYGICPVTSSNYTFDAAYTIPNIKVNIQVFWAQGVSPSASGTSPSTQTAGKASFYPYIRMRYDSNVLTNSKVYVLGQTRRTVTFYDYATVYISGGDKDLTINSNQWSTHSDAMSNILSEFSGRTLSTTEENRVKSSVLPGGATLSLSVNSSNTRQIVVKTIQAYLTGSGKTQVDVTGGTNSLPTDRTQLESIHTSLVSSVSGVASQAYIAQYICTGAKLNSSEMTGAQFVQPGQEFTGNGTRFSVDSKYHFNSYTDSRLNTHVNSPSYSTYTFYTDTMGNIRCSKNNTSPSETEGTIVCTKGSNTLTGGDSVMQEINTKTGVVFFIK